MGAKVRLCRGRRSRRDRSRDSRGHSRSSGRGLDNGLDRDLTSHPDFQVVMGNLDLGQIGLGEHIGQLADQGGINGGFGFLHEPRLSCRFSDVGQGGHGKGIAPDSKPDNDALGDGRKIGVMAEFLPRMDIADMDLDHRDRSATHRIMQGDRGMAECTGIEDDATGPSATLLGETGLLKPVHQHALVVGLANSSMSWP